MNRDIGQQVDVDLDRVLVALRTARPAANFQQRMLAAMAQRAEDLALGAKHSSARQRPGGLWLRWGVAGCVAATVLIAAWFASETHRAASRAAQETSASSRTVTAPRADTSAHAAFAAPRPRDSAARPAPHSLPALTRTSKPASPTLAAPLPAEATCHCDPVAIAEAAAPSRPAPPIPLTQQERRILRLIRDGGYQQVADLDPARLERELARARADFDAYFPSPPPPPADPQEGTTKP